MNEKEVMLIFDKGKKSIVSLEFFLTIWKGTVLIIDPLQTVQQEPYYRIKQIVSYLYIYRYLIILALAGMIYLFVNQAHIGETLFNLMTWVGLAVAIGIIYKESVWGKWRCSIFPHYFFIRQSMGLIALWCGFCQRLLL